MSAVRFTVTKTEGDPIGESSTDPVPGYGTTAGDSDIPEVSIVDPDSKRGRCFCCTSGNY